MGRRSTEGVEEQFCSETEDRFLPVLQETAQLPSLQEDGLLCGSFSVAYPVTATDSLWHKSLGTSHLWGVKQYFVITIFPQVQIDYIAFLLLLNKYFYYIFIYNALVNCNSFYVYTNIIQ